MNAASGQTAASERHRGWRTAIAGANLPPDLAALAASVVGRSRLWRREKHDLARELSAHFADGLAAGRTEKEMIMDFGDPRTAATLVRRAKRRNRHWAARGFVRALQGLGAILLAALVFYTVLAWRYFGGEPNVSRNYAAEYNERIAEIPGESRAYDVYFEAWAAMPRKADSLLNQWPDIGPGDEAYEDALEHLRRAQPAIERLHEAASRPSLGAPLTDATDPRLVEIYRERWPDRPMPEQAPSENPPLVTTLLPWLGELRESARLLSFDAQVAAREGDAERVVRDLGTLLGIARQAADHPALISQLLGVAIHGLALRTCGEVVQREPELLDDAQLRDLAHQLAGFMGGDIRFDFSGERLYFADMIQRIYSDDGKGDGHITAQGLRDLVTLFQEDMPAPTVLSTPLGPLAGAVVAGRAEMTRAFDEYFTLLERDAQLRMWEYDRRSGVEAAIEDLKSDPLRRARYMPIVVLMPALGHAAKTAEGANQLTDATLAGLALELYRREHGEYPASLDELVPAFLPAVPPDRFTGEPLHYAVVEGRPRLWSVGADRDDDGGVAPEEDRHYQSQWFSREEVAARLADPELRRYYDGDWVLWPVR